MHHRSHRLCQHPRDVMEGRLLPCAWPDCPNGMETWRMTAALPSGPVMMERRLVDGSSYVWRRADGAS